jgi:hypothetical protein
MGVWIRRSNPVEKAWLDSSLREYDPTTTSREGRSTIEEGEMKTDEDDEFDRIERENKIKGQPYHFALQRTWVGLTDEEIEVLAKKHNGIFYDCDIQFARAIESKLKDKNVL